MGKGNIYRPTYRDRHGKLKQSRVWWLHYYVDGKLIRENSHTTVRAKAQQQLTITQGTIAKGEEPVSPEVNRCQVSELLALVVEDYRTKKKKTCKSVERRIKLHLAPFFGHMKARQVNGSHLQAYIARRQTLIARKPEAKPRRAADATINRELAILRRGYHLGRKFRLVTTWPEFDMLPENNVRQGFFEEKQRDDVLKHLPGYLRPVFRFCYETGWRTHSEVLALEWRQVDFDAEEIRLDAGQTKNKRGRVFPITRELREILQEQQEETRQIAQERGRIVKHVFHHDGEPIKDYYTAWRNACRKAGCPGRIPHDFRRTAVRNLTRAGVPSTVAMALTGHKTAEVFRRYDIVSARDLKIAVELLETFKDNSKTGQKQAMLLQTDEAK